MRTNNAFLKLELKIPMIMIACSKLNNKFYVSKDKRWWKHFKIVNRKENLEQNQYKSRKLNSHSLKYIHFWIRLKHVYTSLTEKWHILMIIKWLMCMLFERKISSNLSPDCTQVIKWCFICNAFVEVFGII